MKCLYFAKASVKCSIFLSGLAFDVEPYNNFCERCHLDTNYVVTAVITLQEGVNLPLSALERHANQVKRVTALLLCLKNVGWTCLQWKTMNASNSSIPFSWGFCTWWGSCYLFFKEWLLASKGLGSLSSIQKGTLNENSIKIYSSVVWVSSASESG